MAQKKGCTKRQSFFKGILDMLVLKVVAAGPVHGCTISQRIQQISRDFFQAPQGSLYPAHPLEEHGWLEAEWKDTATGGEAKFHKLTPVGRKPLEAEVPHGEKFLDAVSLILRTAQQG